MQAPKYALSGSSSASLKVSGQGSSCLVLGYKVGQAGLVVGADVHVECRCQFLAYPVLDRQNSASGLRVGRVAESWLLLHVEVA